MVPFTLVQSTCKSIFLLTFLRFMRELIVNCCGTTYQRWILADWFDVNCGLKQDCILSPILFNLFISDLTRNINDVGSCLSVGNTSLSILLYADNIVLIADSELQLHSLLIRLNQWCN